MKTVIKCSENERTIRSLVAKVDKVYLHFDSQETWDAFVKMATQEDFLLGGEAPTSAGMDNVIAVYQNGTLCYLGWAGRVCYQCNQVPRIEYRHIRYKGHNGKSVFVYPSINPVFNMMSPFLNFFWYVHLLDFPIFRA